MKLQQLLFKVYVIIVCWTGMINLYFHFPIARFIDDIVFVFLLVNSFCLMKTKDYKLSHFLLIPTIFLIFSTFWGIANGNSILVVLLSLRQYKNFFLIFAIIFFNPTALATIRKYFIFGLMVSLPLSIYQLMASKTWDEISGIFGYGGSGTLSLIIISFVVLELAIRLRDNKKLFSYYLLLLIPIFINETKISFIILPLLILLFVLIFKKMRIVTLIILTLLFSMSFLIINNIYTHLYGRNYIENFSSDSLEVAMNNENSEYDLGRMLRIRIAYSYMMNMNFLDKIFGHGMGSTFVGNISGLYGVDSKKFIGTGLNSGSRIQLFQLIVEFGLVGTLLVLIYFIYIFISILKNDQKTDIDILALILLVISFFGLIYQSIYINPQLSFLFAFSFYKSFDNRKHLQGENH